MAAKVIAFANHKGGVGKTASTVNVAYCLAKRKRRVLVVDCDPQGNASLTLGTVSPYEQPRTVANLFTGLSFSAAAVPSKYEGLDLIPANLNVYATVSTLSNSIKHAEKVSGETARKADAVKSALTAAEKKTENLSKQAGELAQRLETVVNFTTTLEQLTHLKDVDEMWESLYSAHDTISQLRDELTSVQKAMEQDQADIKTLLAFMKKASELEHLMDVDEIWNRTEKQQQDIQMLQQTSGLYTEQFEKLNQADLDKQKQITANKDNIESLKEYKEKLDALIHLEEVDQLWTDVEACTTRIDEREKKEEELVASIQKNSETADKKIDEAVATLTKRVQYAYWIAAGSAGLAVVELILLLTRMI